MNIRSRRCGVDELIGGFDLSSFKISFLYLVTRERLTTEDIGAGSVISTLPTARSLILTSLTKADLVPGLLQFHNNQVLGFQITRRKRHCSQRER